MTEVEKKIEERLQKNIMDMVLPKTDVRFTTAQDTENHRENIIKLIEELVAFYKRSIQEERQGAVNSFCNYFLQTLYKNDYVLFPNPDSLYTYFSGVVKDCLKSLEDKDKEGISVKTNSVNAWCHRCTGSNVTGWMLEIREYCTHYDNDGKYSVRMFVKESDIPTPKPDELGGKELVLKIINRRMTDYANAPVSERRNAYDELYELEKELEEPKPTDRCIKTLKHLDTPPSSDSRLKEEFRDRFGVAWGMHPLIEDMNKELKETSFGEQIWNWILSHAREIGDLT